ncbi:MAG: phosphotransferase family protein [Myxococcota bacterium]|jgi:aminoglycoside phosphotransferase (APT) family kinase protein|nr:phosphotransferase family protein [Myxococcota bacterium]
MSDRPSAGGDEPNSVPLPGRKKSGRGLSPEAMSAKFQAFVAGEEGLGEDGVRVEGLRRLAGGSSRLLWSADLAIEGDGEPASLELVLRQDPPGRIAEGRMGLEFELLKAVASRGVPVPRVYWCDPSSGTLGAPFFAMDRLAGETIPRRLLRDERYAPARSALCGQLGEALARIHAIEVEGAPWAGALPRPAGGDDPALSEIDQAAAGYRAFAVEPHPVLELAERWLRAHVPRTGSLGLVHGDFRLGNFMFDESGLVAVLDWEMAHLGDPAEDLAWFCVRAWRFGADHLPAGGLASREELLAGYRAAGGAPIDPAALHFWEVLGNFKLALVFITQARAYLDGAHATVELASLGRRIAEPEAELLALMEEAG